MKTNFITALLLSFVSMFATAGEWTAGWAQGYSTYYLPLDYKNPEAAGYLELSCNGEEGVNPSIFASFDGNTTFENFAVVINRIDDPQTDVVYGFDRNKISDKSDFKKFYNDLRAAANLDVYAMVNGKKEVRGSQITVPGAGVIQAMDAADFRCKFDPSIKNTSVGPVPTPADFGVEIKFNGSYNVLQVTSKLDDISITGLTLNRGNCTVLAPITKKMPNWYVDPASRDNSFPTNLKFAQKAIYFLEASNSCNDVLEFAIHTDRGSVAYHKE